MPNGLRQQIGLFFISGVIGFVVDAGIVQFMVSKLGSNPYGARVLSFLCAASCTWLFNRRFTFAGHGSNGSKRRQWLRYLVAMAGGFALNYGAYAACVWAFPLVREWPALGVAVGSAAGAVVNFVSSKYWIFAGDSGAAAQPSGNAPTDSGNGV